MNLTEIQLGLKQKLYSKETYFEKTKKGAFSPYSSIK